jgi:drug/metabolite transporter (DMT)-like permease
VATPAENRRGIIAMLMGMLLFVSNDALMKIARETYPAGQAVALRAVFAVVVAFAMVLALRQGDKLRLVARPRVVLRAFIDGLSALIFIWALGHLPLGNITAIGMASPLIIVVLAAFLRIERVGWRRTLAVAVGFCGVLVVVRPGPEGFHAAALIALLNAVLVACRDLLTRRIGNDVPSTVISLAGTVCIGSCAVVLGFAENWVPIWRIETAYLAAAAVLVSLGGFCVISAFRNTDLGVVAGFRYSVVIFAMILGYLVWGDIPEPLAFLGIALIVGSGLYTIYRQEVLPSSNLNRVGGPPPA